MDNGRMIKLVCLFEVKLLIYYTLSRSKGRKPTSQGQPKVYRKHQIYMHAVNVIREWKYTRFIGNLGRGNEWRIPIVDWNLLNSRFCACVVKKCLNVA